MQPKIAIYLILFIGLTSCNTSVDLVHTLAGADTMLIVFYHSQNQQTQDTITIHDKGLIKTMIRQISEKDTNNYKCAYDGKLIFQKARVKRHLMDMEFSISPDCRSVSFKWEGKLYFRELSQVGVGDMKAIRQYPSVYEAQGL